MSHVMWVAATGVLDVAGSVGPRVDVGNNDLGRCCLVQQ